MKFFKGMSPWNKGKKGVQKSTRKGKHLPSPMENKHHSEESRAKISSSLKELFKNKRSSRWKGGYARKLWLNNQRRIMILGNGGNYTLEEWETLKAQYNWTCLCCQKSEPEITLSEDHIIPLSKGGSYNIENIQPLCRSCNSIKHTKIIKYD